MTCSRATITARNLSSEMALFTRGISHSRIERLWTSQAKQSLFILFLNTVDIAYLLKVSIPHFESRVLLLKLAQSRDIG